MYFVQISEPPEVFLVVSPLIRGMKDPFVLLEHLYVPLNADPQKEILRDVWVKAGQAVCHICCDIVHYPVNVNDWLMAGRTGKGTYYRVLSHTMLDMRDDEAFEDH